MPAQRRLGSVNTRSDEQWVSIRVSIAASSLGRSWCTVSTQHVLFVNFAAISLAVIKLLTINDISPSVLIFGSRPALLAQQNSGGASPW